MEKHHNILFLSQYYTENLHRGVAQYALEADWHLNAASARGYPVPEFKWSGIISSLFPGNRFLENFLKNGSAPMVSLTKTIHCPCVISDHEAVGRCGAEHFIEQGYQNFAFYFKESDWHEKTRFHAFKSKLNSTLHRCYPINYTPTPRARTQSVEVRIRMLRRVLSRIPKPVALMVPFDCLAVEALDVCQDMGLHVPKEVGILGVNNDALICGFTRPALSSVDDDEYRIGYEGAALLDRLMRGARLPKRPVLIQPKGVVARKSTDLLDLTEVPDRYVAKAVRFITEHYAEPITTNEVALAAGVSKGMLQSRFTEHIGCTIHEQIEKKRLNHAKRLLTETDLKTSSIAIESGFGSRERFSKRFKQITGVTPMEYRSSNTR
ncbi:MAG: substrate-binding domain-containing protein [Kiritimatiellaceae bacterium]|nr:substrate-binding domain-containing protein [Kiritimatiellaceae bacterium]